MTDKPRAPHATRAPHAIGKLRYALGFTIIAAVALWQKTHNEILFAIGPIAVGGLAVFLTWASGAHGWYALVIWLAALGGAMIGYCDPFKRLD